MITFLAKNLGGEYVMGNFSCFSSSLQCYSILHVRNLCAFSIFRLIQALCDLIFVNVAACFAATAAACTCWVMGS